MITTEYGTRLDDQPVSRSATVDGTPDFVNLYEYDDQERLVALRQTGQAGNAVADKLATFAYNDNDQFVTITRYTSVDGSQLVAVSDVRGLDTCTMLWFEHHSGYDGVII